MTDLIMKKEFKAMKSCPNCHATTRQHYAGKTEMGLQSYRCKHCNTLYTLEPARQNEVVNGLRQALAIQVYATPAFLPMITDASVSETPFKLAPQEVQVAEPAIETVPIAETRPALSHRPDRVRESSQWGWLAEMAVLQSASLMFLAWAFVERRAAASSSQLFSWIGLAALILPIAIRLASTAPTRRERIGLVLLLGMSLYLVKVMYSPIAFTFPDELSHIRNVNEILETRQLFQDNPIQPVTAFYPGLAIVASTLVSFSGLSTFSAGILVIGIARLILFLALFLLFEQASHSPRVASLAVLLYAANPNFLYWTAEYAYEPLALPLLVFVLLAAAKRGMAGDRREHLAWTVVALCGLLTVIITHHMSSYILSALLIALAVFHGIRSRGKHWGPWDLALVAVAATSFWLFFVADLTLVYLTPILRGAVQSVFGVITEKEQTRKLFLAGSAGRVAPLWEQAVAISSVILIALSLPFGVWESWKQHRDKVFALLLAAIAVLYLPMQLLRLTKAGWETANRSSEFLFMGIAFVLALGAIKYGSAKWTGWKSQTVLALLVVTLFFGGLISGWPPRARWPRPYIVAADNNHLVRPQIVSVAEWLLANLGPDHNIAASKADAKMLGSYGQHPFTDTGSSVKKMFLSEAVGPAELETLAKRDIEFVMFDRREISWDHMIGYYFYHQLYSPSSELRLLEPGIFAKFDELPAVSRLLDAGDIVVYAVQSYIVASSNEDVETNGSTP